MPASAEAFARTTSIFFPCEIFIRLHTFLSFILFSTHARLGLSLSCVCPCNVHTSAFILQYFFLFFSLTQTELNLLKISFFPSPFLCLST